MSTSFISQSVYKKTLTISLTRPAAYNALNWEMIRAIQERLKQAQSDPSVQIIILQSMVDKIFCAGGDVKAIYQNQSNPNYTRAFFKSEYALNGLIGSFSKPIIALVNGLTLGGGMGISMPAQYRVANENTLLGMPETTIGFFPDVGAGYFYNKLSQHLALYLALTGTLLSPTEALISGLVSHYVSSSKWEDLICDLKECENRIGIENCLKIYHEPQELSQSFSCIDVIEACFSAQSVEDVLTQLESHPSLFAKNCHEKLITKSPTSLKVTFKKIKQNRTWSLKDVLDQDFTLSQNFVHHPDFMEGIRAQVVDKDRSPRWNPSELQGVTQEMISKLFYSPKA